jgi:L-histidine N-alpha-methyltransferase
MSSAEWTTGASAAHGAQARFRDDVLAGLALHPKRIAPKYFYDRTGSLLFDAISALPEYYLTRAELAIMDARVGELVSRLGPRVRLLEPGAGSGTKTRLLLRALGSSRCTEYVPLDISREHLAETARDLRGELPWLRVTPVCADFVHEIPIAASDDGASNVVYFPGSTIGNFEPAEAERLLGRFRRMAGAGGAVVLGVDLKKEPAALHAAYNDAAGVTAAFNKNLLVRINRELGGELEPETFDHYAFYEPTHGRVEMHLVSTKRQSVSVAGHVFAFEQGESIRTECSYKYDLPGVARLAQGAGLELGDAWLDDARLFAVLLLRPVAA